MVPQDQGIPALDDFYWKDGGEALSLSDTVQSHDDLMVFIAALRKDLNENPASWVNGNVAAYLESIAACIDGQLGSGREIFRHKQRWAEIADVLFAGRVYE